MNPLPIAFRSPEIESLLSGRLTFFRRLACGSLKDVQAGGRLWLREPFHLAAKFEKDYPTRARDLGAKPTFLFEPKPPIAPPGKVRPARFLCRDWHRFHLVVTGRCEQKLRDITDEEIARCGLDGRQHFSTHWNQGMTLGGSNSMWSDNPRVLRFEFELVRKPLPKIDNRKPKYLHKKRGPKPRSTRTARPASRVLVNNRPPRLISPKPFDLPKLGGAQSKLSENPRTNRVPRDQALPSPQPRQGIVRLSAPRHLVGACDRCGTRLAIGCEHYPLEQEAAE